MSTMNAQVFSTKNFEFLIEKQKIHIKSTTSSA